MLTKIPSGKLAAGMFVSDLDRPWIDTPFLFQGFLIENEEQLAQLQQYCKFVTVDSSLSRPDVQAAIFASTPPEPAPSSDQKRSTDEERNVRPSFIPDNITLTRFHNITPVEAELAPASASFERTNAVLSNLIRDICADKELSIQDVEVVVQDMVASMVRNPDAMMLISRMREQDEIVYGHGLNVAIYLVALGRHLGLPKDMLERLGTVGLLLDIGKTRVPKELLQKNGRLTSEEFEIVKEHVQLGLDILKDTPDMHPEILEGIAQHHERENGSGYPAGIAKGKISLFGRMAAIADSFSALTNTRPYADTIPAYEALHTLVSWGGEFYHATIVEQFIQAIGVFPVGSMVELSSGEVAIVISHNKVRRLKPRVLVISTADKSPSPGPTTLDLLYPPATHDSNISILRGLPAGAYGLDPREYYVR